MMRRGVTGSTIMLKCFKKSIPIIGNLTCALRNRQVNSCLPSLTCDLENPQQLIRRRSAVRSTGPDGGRGEE
jgi:hypothetical protein